jgi:hypothetical protein
MPGRFVLGAADGAEGAGADLAENAVAAAYQKTRRRMFAVSDDGCGFPRRYVATHGRFPITGSCRGRIPPEEPFRKCRVIMSRA